jgi:putative dehydrogenase
MQQDTKIGFIGLGAMGFGMAASLCRAGFTVTGHDLREEALTRLVERGGGRAATPEGAARGAQLLFVMVLNDAQVDAVLFGEHGAAAALAEGATVVLSSTVPAGFVRDLGARLAERAVQLLDAPVSGGAVAAEKGELTIMASGAPGAFAAADPALEACARTVYRLGDAPGIGSSVKAVNQLLAGVHVVTAAEAMAFGTALGADPKVLYEYTPRSACDIWVKDLGMVLGIGNDLRMPLPMAAAAFQVVMMAAAQGLGPIDDAGFVKIYESFTGKPIAASRTGDKRG